MHSFGAGARRCLIHRTALTACAPLVPVLADAQFTAPRDGVRLASIRIAPADVPSPLRLRAPMFVAASSFIADPRPQDAMDGDSLQVVALAPLIDAGQSSIP